MKYIWIIFFLNAILLSSCGDKKCMRNVLNGDYVDVSNYINEGYKPFFCEPETTSVCALLKPCNTTLNPAQVNEVNREFFKTYGLTIDLQHHNISYKYSYIITYDLVDVYAVEVELDGHPKKLFFRKENKNLMFPFKEDEGWVIAEDFNP